MVTCDACQSADVTKDASNVTARSGSRVAAREGRLAACLEVETRPVRTGRRAATLDRSDINDITTNGFKPYGSARKLYSFQIDNADAY